MMTASCLSPEREQQPEEQRYTLRVAIPASAPVAARAQDESNALRAQGMGGATRALLPADEYAVHDVQVLAFDAAKTLMGVYEGSPSNLQPIAGSNAGATMDVFVTLPPGTFDLMVVANTQPYWIDLKIMLTIGATQAEVEEFLKFRFAHNTWWETNAAQPKHHIPMWGVKKGVNAANLSSAIYLTRMVAKANIELSPALKTAGYKIKNVWFFNHRVRGSLIPDMGAYAWENVSDTSPATAITPTVPLTSEQTYNFCKNAENDSMSGLLYFFEAPAGVNPVTDIDHATKNPMLVVGLTDAANVLSYYRMDFVQGTTYIPILRNFSYNFTIDEVNGKGYGIPGDARQNGPANLDYKVVVPCGPVTDVATNGLHYLGVSRSKFEFVGAARDQFSTDNLLTAATDYPQGWHAEVDLAAQSWLSVSTLGGIPAATASVAAADAPTGTKVRIYATANTTTADKTGLITFSLKKGATTLIKKTVEVISISGHLFKHGGEDWVAQAADLGPYNYNAIGACPAGYSRPTLAVAESMRTQVPLTNGRNYWSSQVAGVSSGAPPYYPNPIPAHGTKREYGHWNVTGAFNTATTSIPMMHGNSTLYVWSRIRNGINVEELTHVGTGLNGNYDIWSDSSIGVQPLTSGQWLQSMSVYTRIQYRQWLNQLGETPQWVEYNTLFSALSFLPGWTRYEHRSYSQGLGGIVTGVNWSGTVTPRTASAYVRCVKKL